VRWCWAGTWKENLVPPFVVVEVVGIDLLRELGFVMILWPFVEDGRRVCMMGSLARSRISHRQRLVVQPYHGKTPALHRLYYVFGLVQLWWLCVDLVGEQCVGVEHAVLEKVGDHMRWIAVHIFAEGFSFFGTFWSLARRCRGELGAL